MKIIFSYILKFIVNISIKKFNLNKKNKIL